MLFGIGNQRKFESLLVSFQTVIALPLSIHVNHAGVRQVGQN